jgi:hypothetical protein
MASQWESMDALLLEAIAGRGRRGADLREIIDTADYIDRMVFHSHEIEESLRRLLGAALVTERDLRFKATRSGRDLRKAAPHGSVYDRLKWMRSYLDNRIECVSASTWALDSAAYESALSRYCADMRAAIDRSE